MFLFSLSNVTKVFRSNKNSFKAVDHVSLELPSTGLVSIVGKSGCGKSTLLNMLMGIEKASSGVILYEKKKLSRMSKNQLSKYHLSEVSMIYQHYNLLEDLSVVENIALPLMIGGKNPQTSRKKVIELLNRFHLEELIKQKVTTLSGGEKQRVSILRALITNPKAILCDEPTGALDEKNSRLVMDELKEISKGKLVLMVSHNKKLVDQYSDRIIQMHEGKIVSDITKTSIEDKNNSVKRKSSYKSKWILLFVKRLLKRNIVKGLFSYISLTIGFISILLGTGFIFGSEDSQKNALMRNLAIGYATVSETSYYSVTNSPLQFKKSVRPKIELIDEYLSDVDDIEIQPNTNYFFSPFPVGEFCDEEIKNFEMVPLSTAYIENNDVYPEIAGDFFSKTLTNVVVNKEFLDELKIKESEAINTTFFISHETNVTYYTNDEEQPFISDSFSYKMELQIVDVIDEFSFMNSPKVYYSYEALLGKLQNEYLTNISRHKGTNVSVIDYIEQSKDDSPETSYSSFLFLTNLKNYDKLFSIIKATTENEEALQIESSVFTISESYSTFVSSFKDALIFFLAIAFLGVVFILGMISLSNFLENKKQSAILTCLGSRNKTISLIYLIYNSVITILSFISAIGLSMVFESSMNSLIKNGYGLTNLISIPFSEFIGLPYGFILLMFIGAMFCTALFTLLPIFIYKNYSISEELRDE